MTQFCYIIFGLILSINVCNAQELPVNKKTDLISVIDSINCPKTFRISDYESIIRKWIANIRNQKIAETIFGYDGINNQISFMMMPNKTELNNMYVNEGEYQYIEKHKKLGTFSYQIGKITFLLNYYIRNQVAFLEFTRFEYVNHENELLKERFENEKITNKNVFIKTPFANNSKLWKLLKLEHVERFKTLNKHLKDYIGNSLKQTDLISEGDPISYINYKSLTDNMPLQDVIRILRDEGKESSSNSVEQNGKVVHLKTIIWEGRNNNKIIISFSNDKLKTKSQLNL